MKKVLIITYYWPPSGGSGVQRWMYFAKYLPNFDIEPIVLTVRPDYASYKFIDKSFESKTEGIKVFKTKSNEPFNLYSKLIGKSKSDAIPQAFTGESDPNLIQKFSRFVRGNFFIPDARIGWVNYAYHEAVKIIQDEKIDLIITTGPPHSSHLIGLKLRSKFNLKWIADFRDPWTELFYNKLFYRTRFANAKDRKLEERVLNSADKVITIGPTLATILEKKIVKEGKTNSNVEFIYNGYDQEIFKDLVRTQINEKFTICHLGILSDNQPIDGFIDAMKLLIDKNDSLANPIKIQLVGKIAPGILKRIHELDGKIELDLLEYMPHKLAMQQIMNADLLFNSLAEVPNGKYLISGKLIEYIATGNPILCLGSPDGDAAELLEQFPDSKVIDRKNSGEVYTLIQKVYTNWIEKKYPNTQKSLIEKYSRYSSTIKLSKIINGLLN